MIQTYPPSARPISSLSLLVLLAMLSAQTHARSRVLIPSIPESINLCCLCHCTIVVFLLLLHHAWACSLSEPEASKQVVGLLDLLHQAWRVEHDGQAWQDLAMLADIRLINTRRHVGAMSNDQSDLTMPCVIAICHALCPN